MTNLFIIFAIGSAIGWVIEMIYRNIFKKQRINPGFLHGPFLPLYGFGTLILYVISDTSINFLAMLILFTISTTGIELITGLFFIKFLKIKIWDYSNESLNFQGLISAKYTFYWVLLSIGFYYILYPVIIKLLDISTANNMILYLSFAICLYISIDFLYNILNIKTHRFRNIY